MIGKNNRLHFFLNVVENIIYLNSRGGSMGLFFEQDEQKYTKRGTSNWDKCENTPKNSQISGVFCEKDPTGIVKSINFSCDEELIYFFDKGGLKSLELNLTVMQEHFYYQKQQSTCMENLGVYEIKLKRKNVVTIIFTLDFENFVTFYKHLAKYTILTSFQKHFQVLNEIGRGAFSKVYNGLNIISKEIVALKTFDKKFILSLDYGMAIINNEIMNLEKLRKYKLSPLIGVYETNNEIIIAMQKAEAGNMMDYLQLHAEDYSEELIKKIIFKVLQNLKELHSAGFIHRDIKPENIFFHNYSLESALFLGDFGCSVMKKDCTSSKIGRICSGTLGFVAPEIIKTNSYDQKCDLFSLGSLFYFLLTGETLFCNKQAHEIYKIVSDDKVIERKINQLSSINEKSRNLLSKLLKVNPEERISAHEALKHSYFEKMEYHFQSQGEQNLALQSYAQERVRKFFRL